MRIYVSGPDGAERSALASSLAASLGRESVDADAHFRADAGASFVEVVGRRGAPAARDALAAMLETIHRHAVVALTPAMLGEKALRRRLLREDVVLAMTGAKDASEESARSPWDVEGVRAEAAAEAHLAIDLARDGFDEAVRASRAVIAERPVVVPLGARSYRVEIGRGVRDRLAARVAAVTEGAAVLVHDGPDRPWPAEARRALEASGRALVEVVLPAGEEHKTIETATSIWDAALGAEVDRRACVVGVGGGVVGDLVAFAASTLLRGVSLGQLPTTLLSMVDSSVGGKTGFNRPAGKNLVGTFHQPRFVLCDVDALATLPDAERVAGLAEVVKSAWLDGEASVRALEEDAAALRAGDPDATIRAVRMSVALKADIVQQDENETGPRMLLNLGHTVGHGLEAAAGFRDLRHGEGVALGTVAAVRVARSLGRMRAEDGDRLVALLASLGLPTDLDAHLSDRALDFVASDKKRRGGRIRFVVPGAPGNTVIEPLTLDDIRGAVRRSS